MLVNCELGENQLIEHHTLLWGVDKFVSLHCTFFLRFDGNFVYYIDT
jgi:hypothetical protein